MFGGDSGKADSYLMVFGFWVLGLGSWVLVIGFVVSQNQNSFTFEISEFNLLSRI